MKRRTLFSIFAVLAIVLVVAGCAAPVAPSGAPAAATSAPGEEAAAGDASNTLVIAIAEDTASLDPGRAFETLPSIIHKATYQTLVTFPPDSVESVIPNLAKSWEISEDGLVYTFTLDENATFANGSAVTADDVVFSFNRMKNLTANPSFLATGIASVEAPDAATVVLTLTQPDPSILAKLVFGAFSVVSKADVTANGGTDAADAATADTAETWLNSNSAGSGPYVLESWDPGVETVLVRNENYWGTPAGHRARHLPQHPGSRHAEAPASKPATSTSPLTSPPTRCRRCEGNADVTVYQGLSDTLVFLKGNYNPEVGGAFSDPKVMEAVRYALDYEGLRLLGGGETVTPASMLPVGFLGAMEANSGIAARCRKGQGAAGRSRLCRRSRRRAGLPRLHLRRHQLRHLCAEGPGRPERGRLQHHAGAGRGPGGAGELSPGQGTLRPVAVEP